MLKKIIIIFLTLGYNHGILAQVSDIELESLDDISIIEEFEKDDDEVNEKDQEGLNSIAIDGLDQDEEFLTTDFEDITENEDEKLKKVQKSKKQITKYKDQNNEDFNQELNLELIQDFKKENTSNIEEIVLQTKKNSLRKFTRYELKVLKIQLEDIEKSSLKVYHITRGTKLVKIINNKVFYPPKNIIVRAHTLQDFYKNLYIIDKKGNLVYKVYYKDASNINRVTNLYRPPHKFKRITKKIKKSRYDQFFKSSMKFNFHTGLNSPNYTKSLLNNPSGFAPLIRAEATFLSNHDFLFNPGFTLMFESISGAFRTNGRYNISSLSFGPSFKSKPFLNDFSLMIQPRVSAYSRISISQNTSTHIVELAETALLLGLEKENNVPPYGHFTYGFNFQRKWIKTDTKKFYLDVGSHTSFDNSFAIYLGHRSDWIW